MASADAASALRRAWSNAASVEDVRAIAEAQGARIPALDRAQVVQDTCPVRFETKKLSEVSKSYLKCMEGMNSLYFRRPRGSKTLEDVCVPEHAYCPGMEAAPTTLEEAQAQAEDQVAIINRKLPLMDFYLGWLRMLYYVCDLKCPVVPASQVLPEDRGDFSWYLDNVRFGTGNPERALCLVDYTGYTKLSMAGGNKYYWVDVFPDDRSNMLLSDADRVWPIMRKSKPVQREIRRIIRKWDAVDRATGKALFWENVRGTVYDKHGKRHDDAPVTNAVFGMFARLNEDRPLTKPHYDAAKPNGGLKSLVRDDDEIAAAAMRATSSPDGGAPPGPSAPEAEEPAGEAEIVPPPGEGEGAEDAGAGDAGEDAGGERPTVAVAGGLSAMKDLTGKNSRVATTDMPHIEPLRPMDLRVMYWQGIELIPQKRPNSRRIRSVPSKLYPFSPQSYEAVNEIVTLMRRKNAAVYVQQIKRALAMDSELSRRLEQLDRDDKMLLQGFKGSGVETLGDRMTKAQMLANHIHECLEAGADHPHERDLSKMGSVKAEGFADPVPVEQLCVKFVDSDGEQHLIPASLAYKLEKRYLEERQGRNNAGVPDVLDVVADMNKRVREDNKRRQKNFDKLFGGGAGSGAKDKKPARSMRGGIAAALEGLY